MRVTPQALLEAEAPIASLIGKSEKARQKVAPGAWQHTMPQGLPAFVRQLDPPLFVVICR